MTHTSTRLLLNNNTANPITLQIMWVADEDSHGWKGQCTVWKDRKDKIAEGHIVSLRQGQPLGSISVNLDECKGGAWVFHSFEGTGITERDLQWATAWAAIAIRDKRLHMQEEKLY